MRDLGPHDAMIMRNHGLLTCGATIQQAFNTMYQLEMSCRAQVDAMAARTELTLPSEEVLERTAQLYQPGARRPVWRAGVARDAAPAPRGTGPLGVPALLGVTRAAARSGGRHAPIEERQASAARVRTVLPLLPAASTAQRTAEPVPGAWPSRPIRFVVPFAAGGNSDVTARLFAEQIAAAARPARRCGEPERRDGRHRDGGGDPLQARRLHAADRQPGSIINGPLLMAAPRYEPIADLVPVALLGQVPMAITVRPEILVRSLGELVAYSKARPGGVTIGTSGVGGANHLPLELFKAATGANLVHVPYRGGGNTLPDFVAGNVDGVLIELASVLDLHRDGRGRILGVAAPQRSPAAPDIPTFIEQGYEGFVASSFVGLFAPAGTPEEAIRRLQAAIAEAASDPGVLARLASFGADPPTGPELTTPGVAAFLQGELAKARRAIAIAGLKPE